MHNKNTSFSIQVLTMNGTWNIIAIHYVSILGPLTLMHCVEVDTP